MSAAAASPPPRLLGGAIASVVLHGGIVAAFLFVRGAPPPPTAPIYRVQLFAAPAGPPRAGVVQAEAPVKPPEPTPPPTSTAPPRERTLVPVPKPKSASVPKQATPTVAPKPAEQPKPATPQPVAGGGPTGGRGADVANVDTHGIEFPYPAYTNNIVRAIIQQFGTTPLRYVAEVRFVIKRDGSVDPTSIQFVTRSGNYVFDQKAIGAVEAVANAKLFGPLPGGFREDILPVTFRFSPQLIR